MQMQNVVVKQLKLLLSAVWYFDKACLWHIAIYSAGSPGPYQRWSYTRYYKYSFAVPRIHDLVVRKMQLNLYSWHICNHALHSSTHSSILIWSLDPGNPHPTMCCGKPTCQHSTCCMKISPAYIHIFDWLVYKGRLLTKSINNSGPNIKPCGTPLPMEM
jgi:hypothetical protein